MHTFSSVVAYLVDLLGLTDDKPVFEEDIVEENVRWDLWDLRSRTDRRPFALQHVQELCQAHGLAVLCDVCALQKIWKIAFVKMASANWPGASLSNLEKEHVSDNARWEESVKEVKDNLNECDHPVHEIEQILKYYFRSTA